jgi:porphobilinogen synthase
MMDGRVLAIRNILDKNKFHHLPIISYAVKYASAFYAPFRDAAESAPSFGDRSSYQMNPANAKEALREAASDLEEGADILLVKPALAYQDILFQIKERFACPTGCYMVSGEYAMIKAAAQRNWLDEKRVVLETHLSMKRAGANFIVTYWAKDLARWLKK